MNDYNKQRGGFIDPNDPPQNNVIPQPTQEPIHAAIAKPGAKKELDQVSKSIIYQVCLKESANYFHNVRGIPEANDKAASEVCAYALYLAKQSIIDIQTL